MACWAERQAVRAHVHAHARYVQRVGAYGNVHPVPCACPSPRGQAGVRGQVGEGGACAPPTGPAVQVWSITYHSWLTFVLLLWACLIWTVRSRHQLAMLCSPFLLLYGLALCGLRYVWAMDLRPELPSTLGPVSLRQLGLEHTRYPCLDLGAMVSACGAPGWAACAVRPSPRGPVRPAQSGGSMSVEGMNDDLCHRGRCPWVPDASSPGRQRVSVPPASPGETAVRHGVASGRLCQLICPHVSCVRTYV